MSKRFSLMIAWGCQGILLLVSVAALYFLINIEAFAGLIKQSLSLPIQWLTVTGLQWYGLWLVTALYLSVGLIGLYFLRRAFFQFAKGELFSERNSRDLRAFAILLFIQGLAKPLHLALASLLLSFNHPPGQKMLTITLGSDEIKVIALAMVVWVMSDLLVNANALENENKQFV